MIPLRFGTAAECAALRGYLASSAYTTEAVCERFAVPTIYDFKTLREGDARAPAIADRLDLLVRLFMDGSALPEDTAHQLLGEDGVRLLEAAGLLAQHPARTGHLAATVLLYPTEGLHIVSDLGPDAPGVSAEGAPLRPDCVYAAITNSARTFIGSLPAEPCDAFLELCAGTGIAALIAARRARHAWAVDITERATRFAEFNGRLNGLDNLSALQGDLYAPVAGLTFDRIVAHPPYVPASGARLIYADGGHDGEQVTRAILAGLTEHLRPGGRFYCTCIATDRRAAPFEARIREHIGERASEFDVLVLEHQGHSPRDFVLLRVASRTLPRAEVELQYRMYEEIQAERSIFCSVVVQRRDAPRPSFTLRRQAAGSPSSGQIEWLMRWATLLASPEGAERVLHARPRVSPHAQLSVTHRPADGGWQTERCQLSTDVPFPATMEVSANAAMLIASCDGTLTVRERLQRLKTGGVVPQETPEDAFREFMARLVGEGMIELVGWPGEA